MRRDFIFVSLGFIGDAPQGVHPTYVAVCETGVNGTEERR
jgi:hypothetical protein